ncbi:hypothetical protein [Roseisalinus antarcticus]|uniref:Lipoprotein n=1 Tax=Roseisalinus antarcticus TaxID=254357 RepID=A0A1Y5RXZ1_9RHOB|nr:hypothetical protein [Roseisalinus antarcticus]SLN27939.1 hypothetical protein ROA7023_00919 [Roseisalinus antarcticus]
MRRALPCLILLCCALQAGCARFPALDSRLTEADRNAPYPALVPIGPILEQAAEASGEADPAAGLDARAAALRNRAAGLRSPVVPDETRRRMGRGIDTTALR